MGAKLRSTFRVLPPRRRRPPPPDAAHFLKKGMPKIHKGPVWESRYDSISSTCSSRRRRRRRRRVLEEEEEEEGGSARQGAPPDTPATLAGAGPS